MSTNTLTNFFNSPFNGQNQVLAALSEVAILLPVFLLLFTWRGFIQAAAAKWMGDATAEEDGFLTLNPLAHVDLTGLLTILGAFFIISGFFAGAIPRMVLLMMLVMMGVRWTYPVYVDHARLRNYTVGGIITTLAGPMGNFFLGFLAIGAIKLALMFNLPHNALLSIIEIFKTLADIAIFFGVIDLIPLPPFDGGKLLRFLLPYNKQFIVQKLEEYSLYIMLILFFAPGISTVFFQVLGGFAALIKQLFFTIFF